MSTVKYFYFGPQCYGYKYMAKGAREAAKLLGYDYQEIDISKEQVAEKLYFPGNILIDDFLLAYPGSGEEIVEGYKNKGAIKGRIGSYEKKEAKSSKSIKKLPDNIEDGSLICLRKRCNSSEKKAWLVEKAKLTSGVAGFIAYQDGPVAAIEFLREDIIPFSIPNHRKDFLYITCIYNEQTVNWDFRHSLIEKTKEFALDNGFRGISVIVGKSEPYPNGPEEFFIEHGFIKKKDLGKVLLKYKWDSMSFYEWKS